MSRFQRNKLPNVSPVKYKIREGGTNANLAATALTNLNAVPASLIDQPGGVLSIDSDKKLKAEAIAGLSVTGVAIDGPTSLAINQVQAYTITDYDSFINYTITAIGGSVSRSGATITYTAPGTTGPSGFVINGKTVNIAIGVNIVTSPSITNIVNGATNIGSTISLASSAFAVSSGSDTHQWTDWQIATDSGFTSIISQSLSDTINTASWTSGNLTVNTTYYARVRYKGNAYGYSNWSTILTFTTKTSFFPSIEEAMLLSPSPEAYSEFGFAVSITQSGDRVAISAPLKDSSPKADVGAVYIFRKSGTSWIYEATLIHSSTNAGDFFGSSLSLNADGSRIAIGARSAQPSGILANGAVYIFLRTGTSWAQEAVLIPSDLEAGKYFGFSVDIDNGANRVVIGAYGAVTAGSAVGAVYIFLRTGTSWAQEAKILASDRQSGDKFGWSIAVSSDGTRLAVGAPYRSSLGYTNCGAVYIFLRTGTTWDQEAVLIPVTTQDRNDSNNFGCSVDIDFSANRVVIGNRGFKLGKGASHVFLRTGTAWAEEVLLKDIDTVGTPNYGASVSISDDSSRICVGVPKHLLSGSIVGGVYLHTRTGVSWDTKPILSSFSSGTDPNLGTSVDISADGNMLIAGSSFNEPVPIGDSIGVAYIYS